MTFYSDYTYTQSPQTTDADGNTINASAFNVSRSYINVTGNINHIVAFRITPDVVRETGLFNAATAATVANDSLVFRIKYAFAQFNLDDWMTRGSWARFGIQQTPLLDYEEGIYRYRFQGTTFTEREGFYNSADAGASFHYNFGSNYGDVHVGVYNGDGYAKTDPNDQKAIEIRGTVRPFATQKPILRGLRLTGFYFGDNYIKNAERTRLVGQVTFEQQVHQCRVRRDRRARSDVGHEARRGGQRLVVLGDPESEGLGTAAPLRSHDAGSAVHGSDRASAPSSAWPTGSRSRAVSRARSCSTTTARRSRNFTPSLPAQKKIAMHALVNSRRRCP